ncbi:MAG TPA: beta-ketoacyl synthase N-terminal-like domain-containing protein [Candidatus Acidoferrum sp.]|nr:beta-ketoacyl synthase N-terminal-like domain-containing protein [Candidatus Acidoferrum sp.]
MSTNGETPVFIHGTGAVSPAGWGVTPLIAAIAVGDPIPKLQLTRPGWNGRTLEVRQVPPPSPRPAFLANPRLRRTSAISHYMVYAALEAIGSDAAEITAGKINLGVIVCVMSGCVNYSKRFYDETLRDPATASPLVFPETVFNAPSSHLAALLNSTGINYTLVGDPGTYLQGVALAADWLANGLADACVIAGAEENDWLTADAFRLFSKGIVLGDGAGALYVRRNPSRVQLDAITDSHLFTATQTRSLAARRVREQLLCCDHTLLCESAAHDVSRIDAAESEAWGDWTGERVSVKSILGEGLTAAAAWQCVTAVNAIQQGRTAANVSVVGTNQQAIGTRFVAA